MERAGNIMTTWHIQEHVKPKNLVKPIAIEGLPGIGNVGKLAVDFLIDELKAKKLVTIHANGKLMFIKHGFHPKQRSFLNGNNMHF